MKIRTERLLLVLITLTCTAAAAPDPMCLDLIRAFESQRHSDPGRLDADSTHSYDMLALSLDYVVNPGGQPLTGSARLRLAAREALAVIRLNAENMTVLGVNIHDQALPFVVANDTLYVIHTMAAGDTVTLDIDLIAPSVPSGGVGFHSEFDHAYTFSEPYGARLWFPCFDQPFDKLNEVTVAVDMPDNWSLASNGALVSTTYPSPGRRREVYHHDHPITTYLVMLAAGPFTKRFETVDNVLYRYFTFPEDSAAAAFDWQRTPLMTSVLSSMFGPYPFEQYGMVQTSIMGGWGAMEHQTFTTYGRHLVDSLRTFEGIVVHELAHMWFGDAVTCVDFRNLWLNEGFATYLTVLFYEHTEGVQRGQEILQQMAEQYFNNPALGSYSVYDPPPQHLFSQLTYQKAGWVLHMLRTQLLGDSLFFAAMREYVARFRGGHANTEDIIAVVNEVSGQDLRWFFNQWIYMPGHPVLGVALTPRYPASHDVCLYVWQSQPAVTAYRLPISLEVQTAEGLSTHVFWVDEREDSVIMSFPSEVTGAWPSAFQPLLAQINIAPVDEEPAVVRDTRLGPIYPNPFNAATRISFELAVRSRATIRLYDLNGRLVQVLADETFSAGRHEILFQADPFLASGLYFVQMQAGSRTLVAKALLVK